MKYCFCKQNNQYQNKIEDKQRNKEKQQLKMFINSETVNWHLNDYLLSILSAYTQMQLIQSIWS